MAPENGSLRSPQKADAAVNLRASHLQKLPCVPWCNLSRFNHLEPRGLSTVQPVLADLSRPRFMVCEDIPLRSSVSKV